MAKIVRATEFASEDSLENYMRFQILTHKGSKTMCMLRVRPGLIKSNSWRYVACCKQQGPLFFRKHHHPFSRIQRD